MLRRVAFCADLFFQWVSVADLFLCWEKDATGACAVGAIAARWDGA